MKSSNMNNPCWQSQAPANTMILGEHSVVYGHPAIACALDQFITIQWQARSDTDVHIISELAQFKTDLNTLEMHPNLRFVIHALRAFKAQLSFGLNITIKSEFSSTIGLGSSAAVLAAMLHGLNTITQQHYSAITLFEMGHQIIIDIQGRGSGTDLAASLTGGVIYFEPKLNSDKSSTPTKITKLTLTFPLCLIYAGYKMPTSEVLAQVAQQWGNRPQQLNALYQKMGATTQQAFKALQTVQNTEGGEKSSVDQNLFYQSLNTYQELMEQLGVNDDILKQLIEQLNRCDSIHAAKISGSGLGDCVLGLGTLKTCKTDSQNFLQTYQQLQINITPHGATTKLIKR